MTADMEAEGLPDTPLECAPGTAPRVEVETITLWSHDLRMAARS